MGKPVRLAIVGASARAAAQSALRAGFGVVTADLFADEDLRRLCPATRIPQADYPDGLADWLAEQDVDAWMYTGALENHPDLVDRMSEIRPLWGNRGEALRRVRDPMELQHACREHGLSFPETRDSFQDLPIDGSWLSKTQGACGSGVALLDGEAPCRGAAVTGVCAQKKIAGEAHAVVVAGSRVLGITKQLVGDPDFWAPTWGYCGSLAADASTLNKINGQLLRLPRLLSQAFRLTGFIGVDVVIADDRLWVIEVNPRYPASAEVVGPAESVLMWAEHAACFGHRLKAPSEPAKSFVGKAILYAKQSVAVPAELANWMMFQSANGRLADIPAAGARIEAGQPVLTILEGGPPEGVLDRLKTRAAEVESRLYA